MPCPPDHIIYFPSIHPPTLSSAFNCHFSLSLITIWKNCIDRYCLTTLFLLVATTDPILQPMLTSLNNIFYSRGPWLWLYFPSCCIFVYYITSTAHVSSLLCFISFHIAAFGLSGECDVTHCCLCDSRPALWENSCPPVRRRNDTFLLTCEILKLQHGQ